VIDWSALFERIDSLIGNERDEYMALVHRNFAAIGYPGAWEGFASWPRELQKRLQTEWTAWALRDVEWIAGR
jgi:hypothetical protein